MKHNETRNVTILSRIVNRIILFFYKWKGWRIEERFPQGVKKCVIAETALEKLEGRGVKGHRFPSATHLTAQSSVSKRSFG